MESGNNTNENILDWHYFNPEKHVTIALITAHLIWWNLMHWSEGGELIALWPAKQILYYMLACLCGWSAAPKHAFRKDVARLCLWEWFPPIPITEVWLAENSASALGHRKVTWIFHMFRFSPHLLDSEIYVFPFVLFSMEFKNVSVAGSNIQNFNS